mgnify:CR=1 FL=1
MAMKGALCVVLGLCEPLGKIFIKIQMQRDVEE